MLRETPGDEVRRKREASEIDSDWLRLVRVRDDGLRARFESHGLRGTAAELYEPYV